MSALHFGFDHSYARDVPAGFRPGQPARAPAPQLVFLNRPLARELGLDPAAQMARIVDAAKVCRAVLLAEMDGPYWLDRIHWNEDGRRVLARRITDSSLL